MKTLVHLPEKIDILVVGTYLNNYPHFSTTDDYDSVTLKCLKSDSKGVWLDTDGSVSIIPVSEFIKRHGENDFLDEDMIDEDEEYFILMENQSGDIKVQLLGSNQEDLTPENLDFEDYVRYQCKEGSDADLDDVRLIFDEPSKVKKLSLIQLLEHLNLTTEL